jgi:hypothetical protein
VADNLAKFNPTESETLIIGQASEPRPISNRARTETFTWFQSRTTSFIRSNAKSQHSKTRKSYENTKRITSIFVIALAAVFPGRAAELISNGGSNLASQAGFASRSTRQRGAHSNCKRAPSSPVNGDPVPAPRADVTAAHDDAQGPGSHLLYQDFTLPLVSHLRDLGVRLLRRKSGGTFETPDTLDFSTPALNQQARVDILGTGADPFSVAAADVLLNGVSNQETDPLVSGYNHFSLDITGFANAHPSETLRLRFAEVDNVFTFQFGLDNVAITTDSGTAPVPDSGLGVVTLLAFGTVCWAGRRRTF